MTEWHAVTHASIKHQQHEVDKGKILYGMSLGPTMAEADDDEGFGTRAVPTQNKASE